MYKCQHNYFFLFDYSVWILVKGHSAIDLFFKLFLTSVGCQKDHSVTVLILVVNIKLEFKVKENCAN